MGGGGARYAPSGLLPCLVCPRRLGIREVHTDRGTCGARGVTVLGIETATTVCAAALVREGRVVAESFLDAGRVHAEKLMGQIAAGPGS